MSVYRWKDIDPFPHIVIENALPEKLYNELNDTYPTNKFNEIIKNNVVGELSGEKVQKDNEITNLWKNFICEQIVSFITCYQHLSIFVAT